MTTWIRRPDPKPEAQARLLCFPCAGAGASMYRGWTSLVPEEVELCLVQTPGREDRWAEEPVPDLDRLATGLLADMGGLTGAPLAFFGHSMGALFAFRVAQRMRQEGKAAPVHLFVSARAAPHLGTGGRVRHTLPDDEFIDLLRRLGGTPETVLAQPDLLATMLPIIRADFEACEKYQYSADRPLSVPITAFAATDDELAPSASVLAWREHTERGFRFHAFAGGHFYLAGVERLLVRTITRRLSGG